MYSKVYTRYAPKWTLKMFCEWQSLKRIKDANFEERVVVKVEEKLWVVCVFVCRKWSYAIGGNMMTRKTRVN